MRRCINSLVVGSLLFGNIAFAQDFKLPERFKDYKTKSKLISCFALSNKNYSFFLIKYDIEGDGIIDITEAFPDLKNEPLYYGLNLNQDKECGSNELFIDEKRDGWNGNEKLCDPKQETLKFSHAKKLKI